MEYFWKLVFSINKLLGRLITDGFMQVYSLVMSINYLQQEDS